MDAQLLHTSKLPGHDQMRVAGLGLRKVYRLEWLVEGRRLCCHHRGDIVHGFLAGACAAEARLF